MKDLRQWNSALILKHFLAILNPQSTSLWASWVKSSVIKISIWTMKCPASSSWMFRKMLSMRDLVKQNISWRIGNGKDISFWFDPWLNGRSVCLDHRSQMISQSGLPYDAKVECILGPSGWQLPQSNYHDMVIWKQSFPFSTPFDTSKRDVICWNDIIASKLRVTDLWEALRHSDLGVPWSLHVWHKLAVPRYSFLHWLIMLDKVNTADKLVEYGYADSENCMFCINGRESIPHLFMECPFTHRLYQLVCAEKGVSRL